MTLGFKPTGYESIDSKSTLPFVIPAQAGIQVFIGLATQAKMDAGLRRHDKSSLRFKPALSKIEAARKFKHPRKRYNCRVLLSP
jgi:hypothetical protein